MRIKVDHQLQRTAQMQYVIEEPKTDKGIRYVPMTEAVAACFRRIIANRKTPKVEPMVEGYAGFLFLDKNDMPMVALHWEKYMEHIIQKYNRIYRIQMPKVTPHAVSYTHLDVYKRQEKVSCFFSAPNEVVKRHPIHQA